MIILSTYHFKEIEIFFEHFYDQHLISKVSTCSLNKTNIINTIYIYFMLIFLLWNMCCCWFFMYFKKKAGVEYFSTACGRILKMATLALSNLTKLMGSHYSGLHILLGFFLKINSMINILELFINKYLCTSFIVERLSY